MNQRMVALPHLPEVTTVLWDLDGTLVRLHRRLFGVLMPLVAAGAFADLLPPWRFLPMVNDVLPQVRANAGPRTNHDLLVALVAQRADRDPEQVDARLRRLARSGFPLLRFCFRSQPGAVELVGKLAARGLNQVVATNPLWPHEIGLARLAWAGIDAGRFTFIASGESMSRCKPQIDYYRQLLDRLGRQPHECLMIGNDARNDTPAAELGIPVYLLTGDAGGSSGLVTAGDWAGLASWLGVGEGACSSS